MAAGRTEQAPAKINLTLHVLGRRADGYHDLESLVAFADLGDSLSLDPAAPLGLTVAGLTAQASGALSDNLVLKAANALSARVAGLKTGAFALSKNLPVAAGLGGGSSDAGAALRLLARLNDLPSDSPHVRAAALDVGADVPVCLGAAPRMMAGMGERLGPPLRLPPLHVVLVNPGVPTPTQRVFAQMGLAPGAVRQRAPHPVVTDGMTAAALIAALREGANDLEAAASVIAPDIGDVLEQLARQHRCELARMSGSGATCFGLFPTLSSAFAAVRSIRKIRSGWWVQPATLGG